MCPDKSVTHVPGCTGVRPILIGFDAAIARTVLVAPNLQTWDYDGAQWIQRAPPSGNPWLQAFSYPNDWKLFWHPGRQHLRTILNQSSGFRTYEWWPGSGLWLDSGPAIGGLLEYDDSRSVLLSYSWSELGSESAGSAATTQDFGTGCDPRTTLSAFGLPRSGNVAMHLDVRTDVGAQPALVGLGLAQGSLPLGNGCNYLLAQPLGSLNGATDGNGFLHLPLPVPDLPSLRGIQVYAQAVVLAPTAPGGFRATQGLRATIGD
jgi:hypothetical protein